jgi:hypothetical protein
MSSTAGSHTHLPSCVVVCLVFVQRTLDCPHTSSFLYCIWKLATSFIFEIACSNKPLDETLFKTTLLLYFRCLNFKIFFCNTLILLISTGKLSFFVICYLSLCHNILIFFVLVLL